MIISDVHMPDMDGFKLLELVGLEMDLPVIKQGSPFQSVPPSTGGMYRSDKILVRGSLAIGQYYRKRPSAIDFGRRRSISTVGGRLREKRERYLLFPGSPRDLSPAGDSSPAGFSARGDGARTKKGTPRVGTR
ncbi:hypothetical protein BHE74_00014637 [Ensete ventricosum]|nr:hypothetical protein BHE74_00014637 [Ensete ventricosum]